MQTMKQSIIWEIFMRNMGLQGLLTAFTITILRRKHGGYSLPVWVIWKGVLPLNLVKRDHSNVNNRYVI